jgi:hypothetical protein
MTAVLNPPAAETPADEVEVSVVMPCLNEVRTVGRCVDQAVAELQRLERFPR